MHRNLGSLLTGWFVVGLMLAACGGKPPEKATIGVIAPFTGPDSSTGREILNSVRLAAEEWNQSGKLKGCQIVVAGKDDAGDPAQAATAAHALYNEASETLVGVVAHLDDACLAATQKIFFDHRIAAISPGASGIQSGFKNTFRIGANDDAQAEAVLTLFQKHGIRSVVVVHDGPASGGPMAQRVKKGCEASGIQVTGMEGITIGDRDFGPLLAKIREQKPQAVYFGGRLEEGGALLRQLQELDMPQQFIGGASLKSQDFLQTYGEATLGCFVGFPGSPPQQGSGFTALKPGDSATSKAYLASYKLKYHQDAKNYGPLAYDAANVLIAAIAQAISEKDALDREAIIAAVRETNHKGVTGQIAFGQTGNRADQAVTFYEVVKTEAGELDFRTAEVVQP